MKWLKSSCNFPESPHRIVCHLHTGILNGTVPKPCLTQGARCVPSTCLPRNSMFSQQNWIILFDRLFTSFSFNITQNSVLKNWKLFIAYIICSAGLLPIVNIFFEKRKRKVDLNSPARSIIFLPRRSAQLASNRFMHR